MKLLKKLHKVANQPIKSAVKVAGGVVHQTEKLVAGPSKYSAKNVITGVGGKIVQWVEYGGEVVLAVETGGATLPVSAQYHGLAGGPTAVYPSFPEVPTYAALTESDIADQSTPVGGSSSVGTSIGAGSTWIVVAMAVLFVTALAKGRD